MSKKIILSKSKLTEIIERYLKGEPLYKLCKEVNVSNTYLRKIFKELKVEIRSQFKVSMDENYFEKIDTPEKAYFLGLLYADGYYDGKCIAISLQEKDKEILEKFKTIIKHNGKLQFIKRKKENCQNSYRLSICTKKPIKDLIEKGIVRNKTYNMLIPNFIKEELYSHFIRGFFDGDGCITKSKCYCVSFVCQKIFLEHIGSKFIDNCNFINRLYFTKRKKNKDDGVFTLTFNSNIQSLTILNYLYKDSNNLFLKRKYEKYKLLINEIENKNYSSSAFKYVKEDYMKLVKDAKIIINEIEKVQIYI